MLWVLLPAAKAKFLHALALQPASGQDPTTLSAKPEGATLSPYELAEAAAAGGAGPKRQAEGEEVRPKPLTGGGGGMGNKTLNRFRGMER